jgi:hypothetical protein
MTPDTYRAKRRRRNRVRANARHNLSLLSGGVAFGWDTPRNGRVLYDGFIHLGLLRRAELFTADQIAASLAGQDLA